MARYCIIGAGAAGLSAGQALKDTGHEIAWFEKSDRVGGHWNTDYDALHLITSRNQTHFPGYPMPESYPHFPSRQQVLDYQVAFAEHAGLMPLITFGTEVVSITPVPGPGARPPGSHGWKVATSRGDEGIFDAVLVANGHLWEPRIPVESQNYSGRQLHTAHYRNTADLVPGRVLVVGAGNSGCDVAVDVAQSRIPVDIVVRKGVHFQPKMFFGVPRAELPFLSDFTPEEQDLINRLLARVSIGENSAYPGLPDPLSHDLAGGPTTVNDLLLYWIQHGRVGVRPALEKIIDGTTVHFADGGSAKYSSIIWATGFNTALPFLDTDLIRWQDGNPVRHAGGILPIGTDNLYFVGMIAPRGPQIPIYGEQMALIRTMLDIQAAKPDLSLSEHFGRVQEPETRIDVVRADWQRHMADTEAHLRSLQAFVLDAPAGMR